jgi:hypothetical protein
MLWPGSVLVVAFLLVVIDSPMTVYFLVAGVLSFVVTGFLSAMGTDHKERAFMV